MVGEPTGPSGVGCASPGEGSGSDVPVFAFVKALAALPSLSGDAGRSDLTALLPASISAHIRHDPRPLIHLFNLVLACRDHKDGLPALLTALRLMEGDSLLMRHVVWVAADLAGHEWEIEEGHGG
ncbi:MAG TPA: hypothetical protein VGP70_28675 [Actinomadura sp.]|jgi:hypothetical protein|nr:hypothetical protein [Actinomadura sp.]